MKRRRLMTRVEWLQAFRAALEVYKRNDYRATLLALDKLRRRTGSAVRSGVTEWEEAEVLGLRATVLDESGNRRAAVRQYLRLAEFYRGYLRQYGHAVASALEMAASSALRDGNTKPAVSVVNEVLRLRAQFPDASSFLEDLIRGVRIVRDQRNRKTQEARRKRKARVTSNEQMQRKAPPRPKRRR
jgi:hypothetical protein